MNILISNTTDMPIYEQISSQIKGLIASGELSPGDALPSIRLLAKELHISVITTKRAYDELEKDGFIYTVSSKGSYVSDTNSGLIRESRLREIEGLIEKTAALAGMIKLSKKELIEMIDLIYEEADENG
ncbi:GntR family transcriptional regulator [Ruminococcus sp. NK3A76]|uniref:GntR family transcriptional regulator n=1 Tax=Ruminococcus sp. NK3A76 TaxID=877411 RepID=UPI00048A83E3|nr:GntR family transcriptional regulator [Ruminococcus sp. NK3A76]